MAQIAYKSQGAGVATEASGAACSPASPAAVDAGDILIIHAYFEGTTTAPNTPSGFTLLHGPVAVEAVGRHWIFGKIADGSEDGAANALGSQAVTTMRSGRCYSFSGRVSGAIADLVRGFASTTHATDPQMPTVTTTHADSRAVACVVQNDNNALAAATGESGGDWLEAVAEFVAALTPGLVLQIQTATITAPPGTISGGAVAATNDPSGVIGFEIRPEVPPVTGTQASTEANDTASASGTVTVEGSSAVSEANDSASASGIVEVTGTSAVTEANDTASATGEVSDAGVSGAQASTEGDDSASAAGTITVLGSSAIAESADSASASGIVEVTGTQASTEADDIAAASGSVSGINVTGTAAATEEDDNASASGYVGAQQPPPNANDGAWVKLTGEYPGEPRRRLEPHPFPNPAQVFPRAEPAPAIDLRESHADLRVEHADVELAFREGLAGELVAPVVARETNPARTQEALAIALLLAA